MKRHQKTAHDLFIFPRPHGKPYIHVSFWIADPAWKAHHKKTVSPPVVPKEVDESGDLGTISGERSVER